jgi:Bacterial antitoxin of type II TA system, VapB
VRTTLDIDENLLGQVLEISQAKTKKKAIVTALEEYLRLKKKEALIGLIGNYPDYGLSLKDLKKMRDDR